MTNTTTTHAPINLHPGIDLMVPIERIDEPEIAALVDKCKSVINGRAPRMDPNVREAAIETITQYARLGTDACLDELVGFCATRTDLTDEMALAALAAILPLLPDERLDVLMRHIAEVLVTERIAENEVQS